MKTQNFKQFMWAQKKTYAYKHRMLRNMFILTAMVFFLSGGIMWAMGDATQSDFLKIAGVSIAIPLAVATTDPGGEDASVTLKQMKELLKNMGEETDKKIGQINDAVIKGDNVEYEKLKKDFSESAKNYLELQKQVDKLEVSIKGMTALGPIKKRVAMSALLQEKLEKSENWKRYLDNKVAMSIELDLKDFNFPVKLINTITEGASFAGTEPLGTDMMPGVVYAPERPVHIRSLMPVLPTTKNSISYMEETAYQDTTALVAEGAAYTKSDFTLTKRTTNVYKFGTYMKVTNETLEDVEYIVAYISARLPYKLMVLEDSKLLYGAGTTDIEGLTVSADAFAASGVTITNPQRWDVLRLAIKQLRVAEYAATAIILHPEDAALLDLTKDSTGNYIFPVQIVQNGVTRIKNIPIIENTAMVEDDFLVGDFTLGCHAAMRRQIELKFWQQNEDDVLKDLTTVTISERLALVTTRPSAFIFGDFTTAIAAITAGS